jgi:hypothetical protein
MEEVMTFILLFKPCPECFGCGGENDGRDCVSCDGDGFEPIDSADAAILIDKISDTLEPLLKKRVPAAVDVLVDAHRKLVDMILDQ